MTKLCEHCGREIAEYYPCPYCEEDEYAPMKEAEQKISQKRKK